MRLTGWKRWQSQGGESEANQYRVMVKFAQEGAEVVNAAFDMQTEIASLVERIVAPVAVKFAQKELDIVVGQVCRVFEQLSTTSAPANHDFESTAVNILEPVRAKLGEAEFARVVDRLQGAMAGFCQRDEAEAQRYAKRLEQAEQRETLQQQSEPVTPEPWWSTSEQAMWLLVLLWLCTEGHCQLH